MSASRSKVLGGDRILAHLRGDLSSARSSLVVIGPWLDSFVGDLVAEAVSRVTLRVVTRPLETAGDGGWEGNEAFIDRVATRFAECEVRTLAKLHAKAILIDGAIAYVGSANWYRHSLEQARELVVRTNVAAAVGCVDEIEAIWEAATPVALSDDGKQHLLAAPKKAISPLEVTTRKPARVEVETDREKLDPLAKHVLATVQKSFVLGKKR